MWSRNYYIQVKIKRNISKNNQKSQELGDVNKKPNLRIQEIEEAEKQIKGLKTLLNEIYQKISNS
jgi:hypothetical protein